MSANNIQRPPASLKPEAGSSFGVKMASFPEWRVVVGGIISRVSPPYRLVMPLDLWGGERGMVLPSQSRNWYLIGMAEMTIQSVIDRLYRTQRPARTIDTSIGQLLGWIKKVDVRSNPTTGERERYISWRPPEGTTLFEPPEYTSDLQAAYDLALQIDPNTVGAVSFDGIAQLLGDERIEAFNAPTALCIAALKRMQAIEGGRQ